MRSMIATPYDCLQDMSLIYAPSLGQAAQAPMTLARRMLRLGCLFLWVDGWAGVSMLRSGGKPEGQLP